MFKQFLATWKNNHGEKLLIFGVLAGVVMSLVTYFNVLPDVQIVEDNSSVRRLPLSPNLRPNTLFVIISGPALTDPEVPSLRGMVQILQPSGNYENDTIPLLAQPFELDSNGYATVTISIPTIRQYAVACYIDLNNNGELDFVDGLPREPLRLSGEATSAPTSLNLEKSVISAAPSSIMIVHLVFPTDARKLQVASRIED